MSTKKTTTEPPRRGPAPGGLKPALAALLAMAYLAAWWAFGGRPSPSPSPAVPEPTVWYGELPESQRPELRLPDGWYLASPESRRPAIRTAPLVRPARAVSARPGRIRTRSS